MRGMHMIKKTALLMVGMFFMMAAPGVMHIDASAAPDCVIKCFKDCCGDEGICNGDDEKACVVKCVKDCDDSSGSSSIDTKCGGDCLTTCCGDEGKCSGLGEKACVAKCLKGCKDSSDSSTSSSDKLAGKN
jgi:hypothetical protein